MPNLKDQLARAIFDDEAFDLGQPVKLNTPPWPMPVAIRASDSSLLSDPKREKQIDFWCNPLNAINCTEELPPAIATYVRASLSANTRKAYLPDLAQFEVWGGTIPCTENTVAAYLADRATILKPATLARQLVSIGKAHRARGLPSPIQSELVKAVLNGIKRSHGQPQRAAKSLLRDDLFLVLAKMGERPKDIRDRALLLLGFAGGFRRSELVGLDVSNIEHVRQGLVITLKRSKTDQNAGGRKIGIPFGRTRYCPTLAFENWLNVSKITAGPIFRPTSRHGKLDGGRLSTDGLCRMLQARVTDIGIDPLGYSGHSLRSGFATSAAQAGVSTWKIRQ